ncbi:hypothetical protein BCS71_22535 [Vibrio lentus]|uniref:hypothetical protein n=1 Tax=Vibrio TaxID=662 RepID=UPI0002F44BC5|nr:MULTISPECIES: hypothetical protein [Vibrio]
MITSTTNSLSNLDHIDDELSPETLAQSVAQIELINKAEAELNKADVSIATLVKQPASAETLAMIAAQQKQVVMAMVWW